MRLLPSLTWRFDDAPSVPLDPRLLPLLKAIAATGSLRAAVSDSGSSYRAAWGLLRAYQRRLGAPLAVLERGRGASVARLGEQLLAADKSAKQRLARTFERLAVEIRAPSRAKRVAVLRLTIGASHDFALAALGEGLAATDEELKLELSVMGSMDALEQYAAGRVDVAGFHVPLGHERYADWIPCLRLLHRRRDRLIRFVDREQGLIVPRGNPQRIKSLRDIAAKRLRFVNRQRASGTRLLIDSLMNEAGIDAAHIAGYGTEEFTHAAVAATVASGGADVGFGLHAAAAKYSLTFVPLARERYWLVVRSTATRSAPITQLISALQSPMFARIVRRLPGYQSIMAGTIFGIDVLTPERMAFR